MGYLARGHPKGHRKNHTHFMFMNISKPIKSKNSFVSDLGQAAGDDLRHGTLRVATMLCQK
jgi:hypothetical protein